MNFLKSAAHFFGYDLRKHYKVATSDAATTLINAINHYRIDLVLDVFLCGGLVFGGGGDEFGFPGTGAA